MRPTANGRAKNLFDLHYSRVWRLKKARLPVIFAVAIDARCGGRDRRAGERLQIDAKANLNAAAKADRSLASSSIVICHVRVLHTSPNDRSPCATANNPMTNTSADET